MTRPSEPVAAAWASTRSRIPATVWSMKLAGVQVGDSAGDPDDEVAQDVAAPRGVDDLGMELDAVEVAVRRLEAGERRRVRLGGRARSPRAGA